MIERFGKDAAPRLRDVNAEADVTAEEVEKEIAPMEARTQELEEMTVAQLRRVLRQLEQTTSGNKAELIARVIAHEFNLSGEDE